MVSKRAKWIRSTKCETIPCFRKELNLKSKIVKANLKITSMGYYRVLIDGKMITNNVFMPGWTSYLNRVQYQEYDVTKLINNNSRLDILLAEGWGGARVIAWPSK